MEISQDLYDNLLDVFAYNGTEKGGLVFFLENRIISYFLDETGVCSGSTYRPDADSLRKGIKSGAEKGYTEFAFIHGADVAWIQSFLRLNRLEKIKMLLVQYDRIVCYLIDSQKYSEIPLVICNTPVNA